MKPDELKQAVEETLVQLLTPGLKDTLDRMLAKGASVQQVRDIMNHTVQRLARREHTFTELAINQYLDNVEKKKPEPKPTAKVQ